MTSTQPGVTEQAQQLLNARDYGAAAAVLTRHLMVSADDVDALNLLGLAYFQMSRFDDARNTYLQMWGTSPTDFRAMFGVGMSLARLGELDDAAQWLEATLVVKPDFDRARQRLAELLVMRAAQPAAAAAEPAAGTPGGPRRMTSLIVPETAEELKTYRRTSRERARIDMMNEHWHAIPWPVRVLQIGLLVVILVVLISSFV